ncbi:MAG: hypothetical protein V1725_07930 [archaeon]
MLGKILGISLLPFSILIALEELNLFSLTLPFDKVVVGAILMIALQFITIIMLGIHKQGIRTINIITAVVFIIPAVLALFRSFFPGIAQPILLIMAVMMFTEGVYALH